MASFADYLDTGALPGEVRRSSYGDASPQSILEYNLRKRLKFQPNSDIAGKYLQEFLTLQANPNALADSEIKLPADFVAFSKFGQ
jgi:hypothetical protein